MPTNKIAKKLKPLFALRGQDKPGSDAKVSNWLMFPSG
jgi:hypothetical protein